MRRFGSSPAFLLLLVVVAGSLPFGVRTVAPPHVPVTLGPLTLSRAIKGEEAKIIVDRMHGKNVAQTTNLIGVYSGSLGSATLYVTRYSDAEAAIAAGSLMSRRISEGNGVFVHYRRMIVDGLPVSLCAGLGQTHCFFTFRRSVYWLAADHQLAPVALRSLLHSLE